MSPWKVILATIIIFGTGVLTGAFVVEHFTPRRTLPRPSAASMQGSTPLPTPWFVRKEFLHRMDQQLKLNEPQRERIGKILEDSQERTRIVLSLIAPELREELAVVREKIRAELTPEQQPKFEELMSRSRSQQQSKPSRETNRDDRRSGSKAGATQEGKRTGQKDGARKSSMSTNAPATNQIPVEAP